MYRCKAWGLLLVFTYLPTITLERTRHQKLSCVRACIFLMIRTQREAPALPAYRHFDGFSAQRKIVTRSIVKPHGTVRGVPTQRCRYGCFVGSFLHVCDGAATVNDGLHICMTCLYVNRSGTFKRSEAVSCFGSLIDSTATGQNLHRENLSQFRGQVRCLKTSHQ